MPPTSTFLVDDSPSFLQSAARFLASDERIEIVGVSLSAPEALAEVERLRPALVLMDLTMPGMNGLEATRRLKALPFPPHVVILTLHDTQEYRLAAEQAQADGFIAKSDFGQKLIPLLEPLLNSCPPSSHGITIPSPSGPEPSSPISPLEAPLAAPTNLPLSAPAALPAAGVRQVLSADVERETIVAPLIRALPLRSPRRLPSFEVGARGHEGGRLRVLLAEDQAWSHLLAVSMWRAGVETRIALDARSTVDLLEAFEPHLVLLDATSAAIHAPEMCRSIRARSGVPILLVTSGRKLRPDAEADAIKLDNIEEVAVRIADVASVTAGVMDSLRRLYAA